MIAAKTDAKMAVSDSQLDRRVQIHPPVHLVMNDTERLVDNKRLWWTQYDIFRTPSAVAYESKTVQLVFFRLTIGLAALRAIYDFLTEVNGAGLTWGRCFVIPFSETVNGWTVCFTFGRKLEWRLLAFIHFVILTPHSQLWTGILSGSTTSSSSLRDMPRKAGNCSLEVFHYYLMPWYSKKFRSR